MPLSPHITSDDLFRRLGTGFAPAVLDVRTDEDAAADPRLVPTARPVALAAVPALGPSLADREMVVVCEKGKKISEAAAALLRHAGVPARVLTGGHFAWAEAGLPLVPIARIPPRDAAGRTLWVTRARPKIDRIACPWLIRRFVDPSAVFLFVAAEEVPAVADKLGATPFDIEGVFWSHRGERCSFDTMVEEFGLTVPALAHVAGIVRGADTARPDLAPQAAGLLAISLGLSRLFEDDLKQLEAGMTLYDALYLWARDGTSETHNWPSRPNAEARA